MKMIIYKSPSFMPDEVYSLYVQVQFLDGSYSEGFHIPGREPVNGEEFSYY